MDIMFVGSDSLHSSQQFFSYVGTGLPRLNQYSTKQRIKCPSQGCSTVPPVRLEPAIP